MGRRGWWRVDPVHVGGRASRCTGSGGKGCGDGRDRLRGQRGWGQVDPMHVGGRASLIR